MSSAKPAAYKLLMLAAMGLAALNGTPAHAAILQLPPQNFSISSSTFSVGGGFSFFGFHLPFDKFDPSLGALTQVDIELVSTVSGFVNVSGSGSDGNVDASANLAHRPLGRG